MVSDCSNWPVATLDDLTESDSPITYGVVKPGDEGEVKFIRGGDISGGRVLMDQLRTISREVSQQYRRTLLRGGEILVSLVGNPGQVAVAPKELAGANIARQVGLIRLKTSIDTNFISYFLQSPNGQAAFGAHSLGSVQQVINLRDLKTVKVPLPPLAEQKRIAHILGTLDDKIELNRRMNATLEAMARALFQSWFVDFDPVRRNAEGGESRPEDALFPDSFEDSSEGNIPSGWTKTNLGTEADFSFGFAFKSASFVADGDIRLARGDNVKEGFFHWDSKARYWPEITPDLESYRLETGDVLIGMDGSKVGKNWVRVRRCDLPCLLVQRVARIRAKKSIGQHFIWILVSDARFRNHVDAVKTGTSIPHISGGQIKAYDFLRPPVGDNRVFDRFEELVGPLGAQIDANIEQSQTLVALRDMLLPKLLNGELDLESKTFEFV